MNDIRRYLNIISETVLNELKVETVDTNKGYFNADPKAVTVYINPTAKEFKILSKRLKISRFGSKKWRGIIDRDSIYIWDAIACVHNEMERTLGIRGEYFLYLQPVDNINQSYFKENWYNEASSYYANFKECFPINAEDRPGGDGRTISKAVLSAMPILKQLYGIEN